MKKPETQNIIYVLCVLAVACLLIFQILDSGFDSLIIQDRFPVVSKGLTGDPITPESPYEVELQTQDRRIRSISLLFSVSELDEDDRAGVSIFLGDRTETLTFTGRDIVPGEYLDLALPEPIRCGVRETVKIRIFTEGEQIRLALGNKEEPCVRLIYWGISRKGSILLITGFLFLYLAIVIALSIGFKSMRRFIAILAVTGLAFLIVIPYSQVSDDIYHFAREFEITEGYIVSPMTWQEEGKLSPGNLDAGIHYGANYSEILKSRDTRLDPDHKVQYGYSNTALYSPVPYLPQLLGVALGRLLTDRVIIIVFLARICAMLSGIAMLWAAIRITPVNTQIIYAMAFIPIYINEMVSTSADSFVNSLLILYYAWICARVSDTAPGEKPMGFPEMLFVFACPTLLALSKVVYFPFALFLFLIPRERFGTGKRKWLLLIPSHILAAVLYLVWSGRTAPFIDQFNDAVDHSAQIHYALTHPVTYLGILLRSLSVQGVDYFWGMLGDSLGWVQNLHINGMFLTGYLILLVLLIVRQPEHPVYRDRHLFLMNLAMVVLVSVLTLSALYAHDTELAEPLIKGMQGRYFLPVLLPAVTALKYMDFQCREGGSMLRKSAQEILPRYFYLYVGWMEASMMLTVLRELWH